MNTAYLSAKELAARYGVSQLTIWRWAGGKRGFPKAIKLGENCTRWRLSEIEAWEETQSSAA